MNTAFIQRIKYNPMIEVEDNVLNLYRFSVQFDIVKAFFGVCTN